MTATKQFTDKINRMVNRAHGTGFTHGSMAGMLLAFLISDQPWFEALDTLWQIAVYIVVLLIVRYLSQAVMIGQVREELRK